MIVYGSHLSPFVRKVMIYAAEKGIELELQNALPGGTDPEFRRISPFGKIPGFVDGDFAISDSTAIITYLEAKYPEPALIPADPRERARVVWFDEFADTILTAAAGKCFFNRIVAPMMGRPQDLAAADRAEAEELPPIFAWVESQLPESGHFVGDRLTLADISVASPFVNLRHCASPIDAATYPKLAAFLDHWFARASLSPLVAREDKMLKRAA
jgi:glutathione S-transferase